MPRSTEAEVKEIIDTTLTNGQVTPFLATANVLVTEVLVDEGYGQGLLKEIERWLAAHFVAVRDPRLTKDKTGDTDVTYEGKTGLALEHTSYGQQAMSLDHHGRLRETSRGAGVAEVRVIT